MKNIHILPTDKPSRLIHNDANQLCYQSNKSFKNDRKWMYRKKFNIYITNSEEIKEGNWFITNNNEIFKCIKNKEEQCFYSLNASILTKFCKKIILTTDTDLIKDGVQTIDNEFLEWFVMNPSCEEVETKVEFIQTSDNLKDGFYYRIIIPKEEQCTCKEHDPYCCQIHGNCPTCVKKEELKQENCCTPLGQIKRYEDCYGCDRKPKQEKLTYTESAKKEERISNCTMMKRKRETLEEAAEYYVKMQYPMGVEKEYPINDFIQGAKWMQ